MSTSFVSDGPWIEWSLENANLRNKVSKKVLIKMFYQNNFFKLSNIESEIFRVKNEVLVGIYPMDQTVKKF